MRNDWSTVLPHNVLLGLSRRGVWRRFVSSFVFPLVRSTNLGTAQPGAVRTEPQECVLPDLEGRMQLPNTYINDTKKRCTSLHPQSWRVGSSFRSSPHANRAPHWECRDGDPEVCCLSRTASQTAARNTTKASMECVVTDVSKCK